MTIFRFSVVLIALLTSACWSPEAFKPRNELEALLQGNVDDVIGSLEVYISKYSNDQAKLESKLLEAGFKKEEFRKDASEGNTIRTNCQFYSYRRQTAPFGFGASGVVWVCEKGSGANFGYTGP